jgi:hypothetical protein
MSLEKIRHILDEADIGPETRALVDRLIKELLEIVYECEIDQLPDIFAAGRRMSDGAGDHDSIAVIPGTHLHGHCAAVVLAIARGRDSRSRNGLTRVMREVRAHLIRCATVAEVVILLTDRWDPDLMSESEGDFSAHGSGPFRKKVLIPIVVWKRELTVFPWP